MVALERLEQASGAMTDERLIRDASGQEWEVFDESAPSVRRALECDYPPQLREPGLLFVSREGSRRLWPCPADWRELSDDRLADLCERAIEPK